MEIELACPVCDYQTFVKDAFSTFMAEQETWSRATFGEGKRIEGILKHIEKEIAEVRAKPDDLSEWIDIVILALDGYWRNGGKDAMKDILSKASINRSRTYPMPTSDDEPSEHIRLRELEEEAPKPEDEEEQG